MPRIYRVKRHAVTQPLDKPYRFIPLTQGQNAIVDIEDFDRISKWNWIAVWEKRTRSFYALRRKRKSWRAIRMHHAVLKLPIDCQVHHKNFNTLDNRKKNIVPCTHTENMRCRRRLRNNTSGFSGVSLKKEYRRWQAYISVNNKKRYLGYYSTAEEAAHAYDEAAKKYHKEFAHLNFS